MFKRIQLPFLVSVLTIGVVLGILNILDRSNGDGESDPAQTVINPLKRDVERALSGETEEQRVLREAMVAPEVALDSPMTPLEAELGHTEAMRAPVVVEPEIPEPVSDEVQLGRQAEGTKRLIDSFASLRDSEFTDPRSAKAREVVEQMLRTGSQQSSRPPNPGTGSD